MNRRSSVTPLATIPGALAVSLLLAAPVGAQQVTASAGARIPAEAGDFALKVEPGVAIPLTSPQSQLFDVGGSETIKGLWALTPYLDLGPSATFVSLPTEETAGQAGTAWAFGGSVRFKRPHHAPGGAFAAISPWVDLDALYVRTADLNRAGFMAAVGVAVPVGDSRSLWIGPFARYFQILQGVRDGDFDNHDAKILSLGVSLEWGSGIEREAIVSREEYRPVAPLVQDVVVCADRDQDGILDNVDHCPDVAGPLANSGCRAYEKIVVGPDKLELKERLYFAWDQATLQPVSYPVLDEVVLALKENKNFRVQVEGHTSSEGSDDHNQMLSEARADAVLNYLVAHGVEKDRLVSKGFAASVPTDTNKTVAGRDNNRRVEFVVNFIILDEKTK